MALAPNFPADPYVYVLYTYDHCWARRPGAALGHAGVYSDPCPTPPGATGRRLRGQRAPLAPAGRRQHDDRRRAGAHRGLVPAVPEPLDRHPGVRPRRRAVRQRRRRRQLQLRRLRPGRQPGQPLRRPAGRARRRADPADRRRGRAAQPGPAHQPATRSPSTAPSSGSTRPPARALPDNPLASNRRPQRPADHRLRPAQPLPLHLPPRHQRAVGWATSAGTTGRRSTGSPDPTDATVENFGWPCYEGTAASRATTAPTSTSARTSTRRPGAVTAPSSPTTTTTRSSPTRPARSAAPRSPGWRSSSPAATAYPAEYDDALFFADYSRDCIWVMPKGADGQPAPGLIRTFVAGAANPVDLEIGPGGDLFYVDFDGGTIRRIRYTANQPPTAVATASPTTGYAPLTVTFDGSRLERPRRRHPRLRLGPGRRRRLRRRHHGPGELHLHHRRGLHRHPQGHRQPGSCPTPTR